MSRNFTVTRIYMARCYCCYLVIWVIGYCILHKNWCFNVLRKSDTFNVYNIVWCRVHCALAQSHVTLDHCQLLVYMIYMWIFVVFLRYLYENKNGSHGPITLYWNLCYNGAHNIGAVLYVLHPWIEIMHRFFYVLLFADCNTKNLWHALSLHCMLCNKQTCITNFLEIAYFNSRQVPLHDNLRIVMHVRLIFE